MFFENPDLAPEVCPKCLKPIPVEETYVRDEQGRRVHQTCPNQIIRPLTPTTY